MGASNTVFLSKVKCNTKVFNLWDPESFNNCHIIKLYKTGKTGCKLDGTCKIISRLKTCISEVKLNDKVIKIRFIYTRIRSRHRLCDRM